MKTSPEEFLKRRLNQPQISFETARLQTAASLAYGDMNDDEHHLMRRILEERWKFLEKIEHKHALIKEARRFVVNRRLDRLQSLREVAEEAEKEFEHAVATVQQYCSHDRIAEADYIPSTYYTHAIPPIRICEDCGLTEDGWRIYQNLRGHSRDGMPDRMISRNELSRIRAQFDFSFKKD